jgi:hypothetical protein
MCGFFSCTVVALGRVGIVAVAGTAREGAALCVPRIRPYVNNLRQVDGEGDCPMIVFSRLLASSWQGPDGQKMLL